ncbi:MAG TPA: trehalose-phosphatase [Elusimicrobiota bacterium]|jgi:trehalose-phosphatase|nr:trehalose-phosphatase [Elusimicrobiota bacterium]
MISFWKVLPVLRAELHRGRRVLVLSDFDGTLSSLTPRPKGARISTRQRLVLGRLGREGFRLAVISGRELRDLRRRVALPGIVYGGNFGLELMGPGFHFLHPGISGRRAALAATWKQLLRLHRAFPKTVVENKKWGVALHYRGLYHDFKRGEVRAFHAAVSRFRRAELAPGLRWERGAMAWEIFPDVGWDKGVAADVIWRRMDRPYMLAFGDAQTDDPLFDAVRGKGISVQVGPGRKTTATYWLPSVDEVYRALELLAPMRPSGRG